MEFAIVVFLILIIPVIVWVSITGKESEDTHLKVLDAAVNHKIQSALLAALNKNGLAPEQLDLIYERKEFFTEGETSSPYFFKKLKIFRYVDNSYWLGIFYSNRPEGVLQNISELRARRALFLHPQEYQFAFGKYPHRDQLKPFLENSMKNKLERFDPDLHAGEMFATEPIGQEFGARIK